MVYAKAPFAGPEAVLAYLSRYTHRVAIANRRLIAFDQSGVTFRYKDYRRNGADRQMRRRSRLCLMALPASKPTFCHTTGSGLPRECLLAALGVALSGTHGQRVGSGAVRLLSGGPSASFGTAVTWSRSTINKKAVRMPQASRQDAEAATTCEFPIPVRVRPESTER